MNRPKILMVEDSEDNLRILAYRLRKLGDFDLREARDGREAVAAVEADPPDLIFMDLGLPRMDGWEATRRIRELPGGKEVRIVALTARVDRRDYERAVDVGCDDFIPKPVVKSEVIDQALRRWLRRGAAWQHPASVATVQVEKRSPRARGLENATSTSSRSCSAQ